MRNFKHLVIFGLVVVVAVFLAAPSAMAKKAMNEAELDLITAAGQPTIVQAVGSEVAVAVLIDVRDTQMEIGDTAQTNLTALVLNNVAGENQLATALNIMSATGGDNASGVNGQRNTITQSWGSVKDLSATTIAGTDAGNAGSIGKCVFATCDVSADGAPGEIRVLSSSADQIVHAESEDGVAVAVAFQAPITDLFLGGTAQQDLAALVVNNVVGMNQVANAINIAGGSINFGPTQINGVGGTNRGMDQSNNITQYRGTPLTRPCGGPACP
jgi:hypothetical protein